MKWPRISVGEVVMDWLLPITGGVLTVVLVRALGLKPFWVLLLVLPGALVFQWTVLFAITGLERLVEHFRSRGKHR